MGRVLVPRSFDGEIEDREVDSMEPWLGFLMRQHPTHIGLDMALKYTCSRWRSGSQLDPRVLSRPIQLPKAFRVRFTKGVRG